MKKGKLLAMFQDLKIIALVTSLERIKRRAIGVKRKRGEAGTKPSITLKLRGRLLTCWRLIRHNYYQVFYISILINVFPLFTKSILYICITFSLRKLLTI